MANTATCVECGKGFKRTCSCQGNICPACKTAARQASARTARVNGRSSEAATKVVFRVSYRDPRNPRRKPTYHDSPQEAAAVRKAAREQGVRTFLRTVRREVAEAS